jgi:3-(3-hydroxy-phenyl)propionate hydroxylase
MSVIPVVVVGAGPTGICAATLLAQRGVECLVLDRWPEVYRQPRAVHLDDETCRVLARLGVYEEFTAISRPARGLRLVDTDMRVLAEFARPAVGAYGFPQATMFDQPDLETLLRANLARQPRATLRANVEVTAVTQDGPDQVRVDVTDRATGRPDAVLARYLLGCDGANSVVRAAIGAVMQNLRFEQRWLVVDVATDADLGEWEGVHQVCDPERAATYMRIGETRYRWEFRLRDGETSADFASLSALHPLIAPWTKAVPAGELDVVRVAEYTFRAQLADRWRDRRVFLLGDAAHLTPPFVGQGMGAGLRDAVNLAWKLAGVLAGVLPDDVLDTYQQERRPHARSMIRLAILVGWAMTGGGAPGNLMRHAIAPRLRLIPGLRSKVVDSRTPPLRRSALVHRRRIPRQLAGTQLAGTLCPNPVLADGGRLDDLVAGRLTLVTTAPLSATQRAHLAERAAVVVTSPGDELHRWLRRYLARAAVVRPDGTVMRAGRDVDRLCREVRRCIAAPALDRPLVTMDAGTRLPPVRSRSS